MKRPAIIIIIFILGFLWVLFMVAAAVGAPTVVFSGDDALQNGGTDDPYDALVQLDVTSPQVNPDFWELEYSNDGGQSWDLIDANYSSAGNGHRYYFWSTSGIYAPALLVRVRTQQSGAWSDYFQTSLSLSHRVTNHNAHYFVEDFSTTDFQAENNRINWDTSRSLVELGPNPPAYHPNGTVYSTNLLSGLSNNNVVAVTFQPVIWSFDKTIRFQLSNDGSNWYGDTSGVPGGGVWFNFGAVEVPNAVTIPFNGSVGDGLYFKIYLSTNNTNITPQVYQIRLTWQENATPQACFTVDPSGSTSVDQVYSFNANCSSDYEDALNSLDFRWDWENDGIFDTVWQTGSAGYIKTHIFNSTSTFTTNLEVKDAFDAMDSFLNSLNETGVAGSISGWAWSSNYGWISLNCDNVYYGTTIQLCPPTYGWQMNGNYTMDGWAWDSNLGWLCLGATCQPYGNEPVNGTAPAAIYSRATGEINGWAKFITSFAESGWLALNWTTQAGETCGSTGDQCAHLNFSRRTLEGYAWAGGLTGGGVGIGPGWVTFEGNINVPWLETRYGSIYGQNNVGSNQTAITPDNRYNASYCILSSGDIINFSSENSCLLSSYDDLTFPNLSGKFKTILGIIDFDQMLNGQEISVASSNVDANLPQVLDGQVYSFSGQDSYVIDQPLTFYNARNLDSSGAGTIIIDGDLDIRSNLYYEGANVSSKIENLASVAWIIKGDLNISPSVTSLVGDFIVLGQDELGCPAVSCGNFNTGDDSASPAQLVVNGLVMARQFNLERTYKKSGAPAEVMVYDGRVLINTPPGLLDLAKGLPVWREAFSSLQIDQ